MKFPKLTDKQLMLLEVVSNYPNGLEDLDITEELSLKPAISYNQAKAMVPPLLGALSKLGLVKRQDAYWDKDHDYGVWSLSDYGKQALGIKDD